MAIPMILELRATELNGDWPEFWKYYVRREGERLYAAERGDSAFKAA